MNVRVFTMLVAAAVAATGSISGAQTPQQPTFRSGVEIVEVQAVVTDAQGNLVRDLTQADFEIVEGGKPQQIAAFSTVDIPIEPGDRPLYSPTAIEPDVLSNQGDGGRIYLIAFDEMHPTLAIRTRHFLRTFLERYVGANDRVAIGYLSTGARNSQDFTSNKRVLLDSLARFTGGIPGENALVPPPTNPEAEPAPAPTDTLADTDFESRFRLRNRMKAFRDMVEFLAAVPAQRKALLFLSPGMGDAVSAAIDYQGGVMPIEMEDAHVAIRAAATGNVAIYPIDPRGLDAGGGAEFGSFEEAQGAATPAAQRLAAISNARMLAETTGGFAFHNQNNFTQAFQQLVRENSSYYVLGYYSTDDRRNGRFRRLTVRVKRPGLQVRARTGYLAPRGRPTETKAPDKPSPVSAATATALASAVPARGLPMRLSAAPFKGTDGQATVALMMSVDVDALALTPKGDAFNGTLELTTAAVQGSKTLGGEYQTMTLNLKPDTMERARAMGLQVLGEIRLPPGRYQVRAALGNGTRAGSVIQDIEIPDFSKVPLAMSGVALTSRQLASAPTLAAKNPLRDFLPAPPSTTREFASSDTLVLFAEVYDNIRAAAAHTVEISATLRADDGRELRTVSEERSTTELTGSSGGFGFRADLPLDDADPGLYVVRVEARANVGERPVVSRDIAIRIK